MRKQRDARWAIDELVERVEQALAVGYEGPANRRIRQVPNLRTIRYYTTLGLLDRPAEMRGRTAYYGARHLQQLTAIKRLQAEGLSLAEVQEKLLGLSDVELARIANVSEEVLTAQRVSAPASPPQNRREQRFWTTPPAAAKVPEPATRPTPESISVETWQSLTLAPGVRLLLSTDGPLSAETLRELQEAARPLLRVLEHHAGGKPCTR